MGKELLPVPTILLENISKKFHAALKIQLIKNRSYQVYVLISLMTSKKTHPEDICQYFQQNIGIF